MVQHLPVDVQHELGHGMVGPRPLGRAARLGQVVRAEAAHAADPAGVGRVELGQRGRGVAGIAVRGVVERRPAEVRGYPYAEYPDDDVPEPTGDRGHRRRIGLGHGEIDGELARAHLDRRRPRPARPHVPRAGHGLPAVFLVGQPVQPRPQLLAPVPVQLLGQLEAPVNVAHETHPKKQSGQDRSAKARHKARHDGRVTDTAGRLLRLLPLLTARPSWRGDELAARLGVTTRTVRRDIDRLRELGYPVHAVPGRQGGYALGPGGARLPPLLLDEDSAVAVALGLRAAAADPALRGSQEAAARAAAAIDQVLPPRLRRRVEALTVATVPMVPAEPSIEPNDLALIALACQQGERVRFAYRDGAGQDSRRHVEPYRLVWSGRRWYLVARDLDKGEWRSFRLDRMTGARPTGARSRPADPPNAARFV